MINIKRYEENLKKSCLITCPTCGGIGYQRWACIDYGKPQKFKCDECNGEKVVSDMKYINERIRGVIELEQKEIKRYREQLNDINWK